MAKLLFKASPKACEPESSFNGLSGGAAGGVSWV